MPSTIRKLSLESVTESSFFRGDDPGQIISVQSLSLPILHLGTQLPRLESLHLDYVVDARHFFECFGGSGTCHWPNLRRLHVRGRYPNPRKDLSDRSEETTLFIAIAKALGHFPSIEQLEVEMRDILWRPARRGAKAPLPRTFMLQFHRSLPRKLSCPLSRCDMPTGAVLRTYFFEPPRDLVLLWKEAVKQVWSSNVSGYWARNRLAAFLTPWDEGNGDIFEELGEARSSKVPRNPVEN